jgi:hypothetical protein
MELLELVVLVSGGKVLLKLMGKDIEQLNIG